MKAADTQPSRALPYLLHVGIALGLLASCAFVLSLSMAYGLNREMGTIGAVVARCFCYAAGFLISSRHGKKG